MSTATRRSQPKVKELGVRPPPFQSTYVAPNGVDAERMEVTVWHSSGTTGASLVATLEGGMQKGARAGPTGCQNRNESYWPPEVLLDSRHEYEPEHGDV